MRRLLIFVYFLALVLCGQTRRIDSIESKLAAIRAQINAETKKLTPNQQQKVQQLVSGITPIKKTTASDSKYVCRLMTGFHLMKSGRVFSLPRTSGTHRIARWTAGQTTVENEVQAYFDGVNGKANKLAIRRGTNVILITKTKGKGKAKVYINCKVFRRNFSVTLTEQITVTKTGSRIRVRLGNDMIYVNVISPLWISATIKLCEESHKCLFRSSWCYGSKLHKRNLQFSQVAVMSNLFEDCIGHEKVTIKCDERKWCKEGKKVCQESFDQVTKNLECKGLHIRKYIKKCTLEYCQNYKHMDAKIIVKTALLAWQEYVSFDKKECVEKTTPPPTTTLPPRTPPPKIGCDGFINSNLCFDNCGVCGGDGSSCRTTKPPRTSSSTPTPTLPPVITPRPTPPPTPRPPPPPTPTLPPVITPRPTPVPTPRPPPPPTPTLPPALSPEPSPSSTPTTSECPRRDECGVCGGNSTTCGPSQCLSVNTTCLYFKAWNDNTTCVSGLDLPCIANQIQSINASCYAAACSSVSCDLKHPCLQQTCMPRQCIAPKHINNYCFNTTVLCVPGVGVGIIAGSAAAAGGAIAAGFAGYNSLIKVPDEAPMLTPDFANQLVDNNPLFVPQNVWGESQVYSAPGL